MKRFINTEIRIRSSCVRIIECLTDPKELKACWAVDDAFIEKKDGGHYILTWFKSEHGVKLVQTAKIRVLNTRSHLHLEDVMYINSEKSILGPFLIKYDIEEHNSYSILKITHSGFEKSGDWQWYYEHMQDSWPQALLFLKQYLEKN